MLSWSLILSPLPYCAQLDLVNEGIGPCYLVVIQEVLHFVQRQCWDYFHGGVGGFNMGSVILHSWKWRFWAPIEYHTQEAVCTHLLNTKLSFPLVLLAVFVATQHIAMNTAAQATGSHAHPTLWGWAWVAGLSLSWSLSMHTAILSVLAWVLLHASVCPENGILRCYWQDKIAYQILNCKEK